MNHSNTKLPIQRHNERQIRRFRSCMTSDLKGLLVLFSLLLLLLSLSVPPNAFVKGTPFPTENVQRATNGEVDLPITESLDQI